MFLYDWTIILLIPALIFTFYAQHKVNSAYKKYSTIPNSKGYTAAEVARQLLIANRITDVTVEQLKGSSIQSDLMNHYDPGTKILRLSEGVYNSPSLAAIGIAAHETGHAIQHNMGYTPLALRSGLVPVANIGTRMAMPLFIVGIFLASGYGSIGMFLMNAGILLYTLAVVFYIITLPVEYNASGRAIELLSEYRILSQDEIEPAKKVLSAAALTYVAAALTALLTLLRLILIANGRRR